MRAWVGPQRLARPAPGSFNRLPAHDVIDGVSLRVHQCRVPRSGWSDAYPLSRSVLVIVRRGGYLKKLDRIEHYVGPAVGYFEPRGAQHASRHPDDGGDVATLLFMSDTAASRLTGLDELPTEPFALPSDLDLDHRLFVRHLQRIGMCPFEAEEWLAAVVGGLAVIAGRPRPQGRRPATQRAHRSIVDAAREAINARPVDATLTDVARAAGSSPFHVSRVFRRSTGLTLSEYRNRVRVATAMDRLENGEGDLAGVAADLGFADQSHMTRVFVEHVGRPPGKVRGELTRDRVATARMRPSSIGL